MSRRDTIVIAVLVNAALLMILFATATRTDETASVQKEGMQIAEAKVKEKSGISKIESAHHEDVHSYASIPTLGEPGRDGFFSFEDTQFAFADVPAEVIAPKVVSSNPFPAEVNMGITTQQPELQFANVTVKKGDFLEKIAKANNTTVAAIMKANKLSSSQLKVGQVLKIPLNQETKTSPNSSAQKPAAFGEDFYVVKEGDNPWLIAHRNKVSLEELLRINDLDEQKAKRLRPGDKLRIR